MSAPDGLPGVVVGVVTDTRDPRAVGRVRVRCPTLPGAVETVWAQVVTPVTEPGPGRPTRLAVGDTVVVAFEHGDVDHPLVLGGLRSPAQ